MTTPKYIQELEALGSATYTEIEDLLTRTAEAEYKRGWEDACDKVADAIYQSNQ
jgi:hypothetical protein